MTNLNNRKAVANVKITQAFYRASPLELFENKVGIYPFYYFVPHDFRDEVHKTAGQVQYLLRNCSLNPFVTNEWGTTAEVYEWKEDQQIYKKGWQRIPKEFEIDLGGRSIDEWIKN